MVTEENERTEANDREVIILAVERQLAAGMTLARLSNLTEVDMVTLDSLIKRGHSGFGHEAKRRQAAALVKLRAWLADIETDRDANRQALAATPTYQRITAALRIAHEAGELVAITGGVGIGKSQAARAYALAHPMGVNAPGALRVAFRESDKKSAAALSAIGNAVGREGGGRPGYRNGNLMDQISAALRRGDVLLLDEYNYLEGGAINIGRDLNDTTGVGVAMIGNPDFSSKVWGRSEEFAALANRALRYDFPTNTEEDVDVWLNWKGFLGAQLRAVAIKIAVRPGKYAGLRSLEKLTDNIVRLYGAEALDAKLLEATARQMGRYQA